MIVKTVLDELDKLGVLNQAQHHYEGKDGIPPPPPPPRMCSFL